MIGVFSTVLNERSTRSNALAMAAQLRRAGYRLSVLAVGGAEAAPVIKNGQAVLQHGKPVLVRANLRILADLAQRGGGLFHRHPKCQH